MIRIKQYFFLLMLLFLWQGVLLSQTIEQRRIDSLLVMLENGKEDTNKVNTLNELVVQYSTVNNLDKTKEYGEKSILLAGSLGFKSGKAKAHDLLGQAESTAGNFENAIKNFEVAKVINEQLGNKAEAAMNLGNIGRAYMKEGKLSEALKCQQTALKIHGEIGNKRGMLTANMNLGAVYGNQGSYPDALKHFLIGLKSARELKDDNTIATALRQIANVYTYENNFTEALNFYNESLKMMKATGNKQGLTGVLGGMAVIYERQDKHDEALDLFMQTLNINEELGNKWGIAESNNQIGIIYVAKENYVEALKRHKIALKIREEIGDKWGIAESYGNIAKVLSIQGPLLKPNKAKLKYYEAITYANKAIPLVKEVGAKATESEVYLILSNLYNSMGDYKNAFEYNRIHFTLLDSIMNNETTQKLEQQRTKYEVEKSVEEEKIKNETALAEQKAERKRKNQLLLGGVAILAVISFLIALLIRQRNQKKRAVEKAETGHKMAELELQSLRAQLNPHFMFNSLNAIQDLIVNENNEKSHLYLSRFSKLLRMLLDNADQPFVTVKQEIEFLELYLSLENLRIPNLQFSIEKDTNLDTEKRMIPNMMLQPYIENAIWHGLSNKKGERRLQIRIHENGNATEFEVEDNGIGRKKSAELKQQFRHGHHSKGMQLLSKRFELLSKEYGSSIQTTITDLENNGDAIGTLVKIDVPFVLSEQAKQLVNDTNHHN